MADDDDQRRDDGDEKPAEIPEAEIPEVDAEIVEDEAAGDAAPFDEPAQSDTPRPPRRSFISPGVVVFATLVIVSIAAGAVWYFTSGAEPVSRTPAQAAPTERADTEHESEIADAPDDKLVNNAGGDVKKTAQTAPEILAQTTPSQTTTPTGEHTGDNAFPAPARIIENDELQTAAKEALNHDEIIEEASDEETPPLSFEVDEGPKSLDSNIAESADTDADDEAALDLTDNPYPDAFYPPEETGPDADSAALDQEEAASAMEQSVTRNEIAALEEVIQSLRTEIAQTRDALSQAQSDLNAARDEIASLRAENASLRETARNAPSVAGVVALNEIEAAVEKGAPFAAQLAALEEAAPDPGAVAMLRPYAEGGAPAMIQIRIDFADAARAGLASANRENANGLVGRYGARIAGLFNLRPAEPMPGPAPGAVISRAEHAVDQGDLAGAIAEIEGLPPGAQEAMSAWVTMASERATINAALGRLNAAFAEQATAPETL